ncbi:cytochrome c biogenesis protein ResB [Microlunatus ginsengisoli]|uniref:Cytochrome c biogenesis protein ResB n=2 Tax=Microlunatus ginsengisoli TaxID=363863 RepID=A0ABP6ZH84_9ACTN
MTSDLETSETQLPVDPENAPRRPGRNGDAPAIGWRGGLRFVWTQLSSMRTALVLLFLLALAAIPGSLVPQRKISPIRVDDFIVAHPTLGPIYDKIGMFAVYSSPWFSAIYLLLFVSLVGCIIPRVGVYARALRADPPRTPRNLARLPAYASREAPAGGLDSAGTGVLDRAAADLKSARYRVVRHDDSIAAERGYLREAGNLLFHLSLLVLLLGVAINGLFGYRGTSVVVVGQGFTNTLTQYDDLTAGAAFKESALEPFTVLVKNFEVKFETGPVQRGAARLFRADVEVAEGAGGTPHAETLEVNHPLNIHGTTVHLIAHGYAPKVTVRDGNGNVAFSGPVVFLPQDGNFMSAGVIKVPDAQPKRLAFQGLFLPTAVVTNADAAPVSAFPDALNPALLLDIWSGPPKTETGRPENVYSLDTTGLTQSKKADGQPIRFALQPGDTYDLPDGLGTVTMDGWERWVKLQVGDTPGMPIAIGAIGFAVFGLCLSLFVRPRRVWVRVRTAESGSRVVEVGGLDRADARAGLTEDVTELADRLVGEPRERG